MIHVKVNKILNWQYQFKESSGTFGEYRWVLFAKTILPEESGIWYDFDIYKNGEYLGDSMLFVADNNPIYTDAEAAEIVIESEW